MLIPIIIVGLYIYLPFLLKKNVKVVVDESEIETHDDFKDRVQKYDIIKCSFAINNLEHSFVYEEKYNERVSYHIHFYLVSRNNIFSQKLKAKYTGGTNIENTTFSELVKMVKEDCSQFQKAKGDYYDETINWSYSPYTPEPPRPPKPERTEEEEAEWQEMMLQRTMEIGKKTKRIEAEIISE